MGQLQSILKHIWENNIKDSFSKGRLNTERQLQADLYFHLKSSCSDKYEIWVEPVIYNLDKIKPDLIITDSSKQEVVCVIELKLTTWAESHITSDLSKLVRFYDLSKKEGSTIDLGFFPISSNLDANQRRNIISYPLSKSLETAFMVISKPGSFAVKKEEVLKYAPPENFHHFVGSINDDQVISFQKIE